MRRPVAHAHRSPARSAACLPTPAARHPVITCRVVAESVPSSGKRAALGWGAAAAAAAATYGFAAQPLTAHAEAPWKAEKGKGGDIAVSGSSREPAVGNAAGRAIAPLLPLHTRCRCRLLWPARAPAWHGAAGW